MEHSNCIFDEAFDNDLEKLQRSQKGLAALQNDWRGAMRDHLSLNRNQTAELDDLGCISVLIVQRQFRRGHRHGGIMHISSDNNGVHTLSIVGSDILPTNQTVVVCDRRGTGGRKCRWFPKDRNAS